MKSPKSLALLMLTLAGNSIYAAETSLNPSSSLVASSSTSNTSVATPEWFNLTLPDAIATQDFTPSWRHRLQGFAMPTIAGGALFGAGYLASKKIPYPYTCLATASLATILGGACAKLGLDEYQRAQKWLKPIISRSNNARANVRRNFERLNNNDDITADALISWIKSLAVPRPRDGIEGSPEIAKQLNEIEKNLRSISGKINKFISEQSIKKLYIPREQYPTNETETQDGLARLNNEAFKIKCDFLTWMEECHPDVFSTAKNGVVSGASISETQASANVAEMNTPGTLYHRLKLKMNESEGMIFGGAFTAVCAAAVIAWQWFTRPSR